MRHRGVMFTQLVVGLRVRPTTTGGTDRNAMRIDYGISISDDSPRPTDVVNDWNEWRLECVAP